MKKVINGGVRSCKYLSLVTLSVLALLFIIHVSLVNADQSPPVNPQSNAIGLQGTINSNPPSTGATIGTPSNGQTFTSEPITVSGLCPSGLLVELYINNVFSGSDVCTNGSYSIVAPLFNGTNSLVVIDYDALNQAGPSSSAVVVTFDNSQAGLGPGITLTSSYARLGANPGSVLSWPIIISGGNPPYAIDVQWGDNSSSLLSETGSGSFNITHTYTSAGVYDVLIKVTDTAGNVSYLQLAAVANGKIQQNTTTSTGTKTTTKPAKLSSTIVFCLIAGAIIVPVGTFWLGRRHMLRVVRRKLEIGERPF
jgi:hypothetical protein